MKSRLIGTSGVAVPELAFGCASIGNLYREVTDEDAQSVLHTAWDAGIRYFDTAPHYGRGLSELRLGRFLAGRSGFTLSTKVGRILSPAQSPIAEVDGFVNPAHNDVRYDYSGDGIEEAIDQSLSRLGQTSVDIAYVHDLGDYTHGAANAAHMEAFFGSGYERLVRLKRAGTIRAFGLGVNECQVCLDVMDHGPLDVILLAGRLTLLDRSAEAALVPRCMAEGTGIAVGGVFNSGILATGPVAGASYDYGPAPQTVLDRVGALQNAAAAHGLSLATAALHFARRHPAVVSVLLGTARPESLLRNLEGWAQEIPAGAADLLGEFVGAQGR
ncbi:aldo/keto reductase [Roseinatronobacter alkalisoli]|uniref:Aldo/keto reductase n=1 Tax=Roseinatronobacter alkalisoli TaxID=3028235 RepID=A0ABT5TF83_9RHOB|nr:aldo/keto reductase [Roseinatronobacter sp. HJB301]MDD7973779.1 aldo/keto reductase [Roseinatronobacter sp. HJB301]